MTKDQILTRDERNIVRNKHLADNIVIIDGFPGCGKTLFGPIVSALDRVELLNYAFEIEFICRLYKLNKITNDAAISMVKMLIDHKLYQTMMGRETNFRYSDLSSVFNDPHPLRYFRRIFQEGDMAVPDRITKEKPILSLTTHDLLAYSEPVFKGLDKRVTFIEIVRHPLYMIIQETLNMERLFADANARDIQIYYDYNKKELPYFCFGWEELFIKSNNVEKAIYAIDRCTQANNDARAYVNKYYESSLITIPFEKFVLDPNPFVAKMANALGTKITSATVKALKRQNVPRNKISDGIPLEVYKRCGWEPPEKELSEEGELSKRRDWAIEMGASKEAIKCLDSLTSDYIKKFL